MNIERKKFKYRSVRDQILKTIIERNLEEGSNLPPEAELCSMLKVARNTVRTALDSLASEGIIEKRKGHPCVIRRAVSLPPPRKIAWINAGEGTAGFNPVYSDIFRFVAEEAVKRNLRLEIIYLYSESMLEIFASKNNDYIGFIFNSTRPAPFNDRVLRTFPGKIVVVDSIQHTEPCNMVQTDNYAGGRMAVEHLVRSGHKKIAVLGCGEWCMTYQPFVERIRGYKDVLMENGLEQQCIVSVNPRDALNFTEYLQLNLEKLKCCDGVFITNDLFGSIAMADFQMFGVHVPEDLSVVSFDGITLSRFTTPPLTTVRQPVEKIASGLIDMILDMDSGEQTVPEICKIMPELIVGETVKTRENQDSEKPKISKGKG